MSVKEMTVFQTKLGEKWITFLAEKFEDWHNLEKNLPEVLGEGWTIQESSFEFVKRLAKVQSSGSLTILYNP